MRLQVTPAELEGVARGLSGLLGELEHAGDIRSISPAAAENAELQAAIEQLIVRWTGDIHDLQTRLAELSGQLDNASAEYDQVERVVTQNVTLAAPVAENASRDTGA
jgi:hypothetical protein